MIDYSTFNTKFIGSVDAALITLKGKTVGRISADI